MKCQYQLGRTHNFFEVMNPGPRHVTGVANIAVRPGPQIRLDKTMCSVGIWIEVNSQRAEPIKKKVGVPNPGPRHVTGAAVMEFLGP
jgi:hypothetical protein